MIVIIYIFISNYKKRIIGIQKMSLQQMENESIPSNTKYACFDTETTGTSRKSLILQLAIGFLMKMNY